MGRVALDQDRMKSREDETNVEKGARVSRQSNAAIEGPTVTQTNTIEDPKHKPLPPLLSRQGELIGENLNHYAN
jgi:hypothetical protein